jgi:hypothetical protein
MSPLDKNTSSTYFEEDYAQLVSYLENTESSLKKLLNIPSKCRVGFSEQVKVYLFIGVEFTDEDRERLSYSSEEYDLIRADMKRDLKQMNNLEKEDDSSFCYRGLVSSVWITTRSVSERRRACKCSQILTLSCFSHYSRNHELRSVLELVNATKKACFTQCSWNNICKVEETPTLLIPLEMGTQSL